MFFTRPVVFNPILQNSYKIQSTQYCTFRKLPWLFVIEIPKTDDYAMELAQNV